MVVTKASSIQRKIFSPPNDRSGETLFLKILKSKLKILKFKIL
jgi:hypothetical protein